MASYTLGEVAAWVGGEIRDDNGVRLFQIASLQNAVPGHVAYLKDSRYSAMLAGTKAGAVLLAPEHAGLTRIPKILVKNPYLAFAKVSAQFNRGARPKPGLASGACVAPDAKVDATASIGENAVISSGAVIGKDTVIGPGCFIGEEASVGDSCCLAANVVVYHGCQIGRFCTIHAGSVIGADGFGYAEEEGAWVKIPQIGKAIIGNHVEIGANTTIDRGALDDTVIEDGVIIDNLVQIGHNCRIGAHTAIAGCVGIAGSAVIGKYCKIGGAAMMLGHLQIADNVTISAGSMITRSIQQPGTYTALMPFQEHEAWLRTAAQVRRLETLAERVSQLEKELKKLKGSDQ
jgi:UDP-3-O-[3-hydroxymyristoyl] glucosamine N-acyltransferase